MRLPFLAVLLVLGPSLVTLAESRPVASTPLSLIYSAEVPAGDHHVVWKLDAGHDAELWVGVTERSRETYSAITAFRSTSTGYVWEISNHFFGRRGGLMLDPGVYLLVAVLHTPVATTHFLEAAPDLNVTHLQSGDALVSAYFRLPGDGLQDSDVTSFNVVDSDEHAHDALWTGSSSLSTRHLNAGPSLTWAAAFVAVDAGTAVAEIEWSRYGRATADIYPIVGPLTGAITLKVDVGTGRSAIQLETSSMAYSPWIALGHWTIPLSQDTLTQPIVPRDERLLPMVSEGHDSICHSDCLSMGCVRPVRGR